MEASVSRVFAQVNRLMKHCSYNIGNCSKESDELRKRDLAVIIWNMIAMEVVNVDECSELKHELGNALCIALKPTTVLLDLTEVLSVQEVSSQRIKVALKACVERYFEKGMKLVCQYSGSELTKDFGMNCGNCELCHCYYQIVNILGTVLDSPCSGWLEQFLECMTCPLATVFLERQNCFFELKVGLLLFQYFILLSNGEVAIKFHRLLSPLLYFCVKDNGMDVKFSPLPNHKALLAEALPLASVIAQYAQEPFNTIISFVGSRLVSSYVQPG